MRRVKQFVGQEGVKTGQVSSAPVNGLPAASTQFEAQTEQGAVQGVVAFIRVRGSHLPAPRLHAGGKLQAYDKTFRSSIGSFSELKDPARLNVEPYKVELVKVDREMTVADFNAKYPSTIPVERVTVVNGFDTPVGSDPGGYHDQADHRREGGTGAPNGGAGGHDFGSAERDGPGLRRPGPLSRWNRGCSAPSCGTPRACWSPRSFS